MEEKLKLQTKNNTNLEKAVTKQGRMLKNIAKKYVKLQKDETFNAESIQVSADIIERLENQKKKLENELAERNKAFEQFKLWNIFVVKIKVQIIYEDKLAIIAIRM